MRMEPGRNDSILFNNAEFLVADETHRTPVRRSLLGRVAAAALRWERRPTPLSPGPPSVHRGAGGHRGAGKPNKRRQPSYGVHDASDDAVDGEPAGPAGRRARRHRPDQPNQDLAEGQAAILVPELGPDPGEPRRPEAAEHARSDGRVPEELLDWDTIIGSLPT